MYTVAEAAQICGVKTNTMHQYVKRYGIGMWIDGRWTLNDDDIRVVEARMIDNKPVGRRAK